MTFIRNAWYVADWGAEVDSAPLARVIGSTPIDQGGVRARQIIARRIRAQNPARKAAE